MMILMKMYARLFQRRDGRAALLSALEQLPVEYDVGVPSAPADRGLRRRHPGLQRGLPQGAQGFTFFYISSNRFVSPFFSNPALLLWGKVGPIYLQSNIHLIIDSLKIKK